MYPQGFSDEEYAELRAIVTELGQVGEFDANELGGVYIARNPQRLQSPERPLNAGSIATIL